MSRLLAFLAVLALVVSPLNAAAAREACARMTPQIMAMADHGDAASKAVAADPCCDHGQKAPADHDKTCAQACAAMCVPAAAIGQTHTAIVLAVVIQPPVAPPDVPLADRTPSPAQPPPRPIA
jgi:hypothetical protein